VDIFLPPVAEQQLLAKYLHALDAKVKRYIRTKRALIARLQEQKQAIIQRAVTRGLDPNVKLKPSGVEWLGEVPEHWEVVPIRRKATRIRTGSTPPTSQLEYYRHGTLPWHGPSSIGSSIEVGKPVKLINQAAVDHGVARVFGPGSVLVVGIGATLGKVAHLDHLASVNQQITAITFDERVAFGRYMAYQLKQSEALLIGTAPIATLAILDKHAIASFQVGVPPIEEQRRIVEALDSELGHLEAPIILAEQTLKRVNEYHTRLIADVVTGAVDVRAVAKVMDEPIDTEPMEEEPVADIAEGEQV